MLLRFPKLYVNRFKISIFYFDSLIELYYIYSFTPFVDNNIYGLFLV